MRMRELHSYKLKILNDLKKADISLAEYFKFCEGKLSPQCLQIFRMYMSAVNIEAVTIAKSCNIQVCQVCTALSRCFKYAQDLCDVLINGYTVESPIYTLDISAFLVSRLRKGGYLFIKDVLPWQPSPVDNDYGLGRSLHTQLRQGLHAAGFVSENPQARHPRRSLASDLYVKVKPHFDDYLAFLSRYISADERDLLVDVTRNRLTYSDVADKLNITKQAVYERVSRVCSIGADLYPIYLEGGFSRDTSIRILQFAIPCIRNLETVGIYTLGDYLSADRNTLRSVHYFGTKKLTWISDFLNKENIK